VSFISPLAFHNLHQESVNEIDPIDTSCKRDLSLLEVKEEKFSFLSAIVV
jgi:hypothetical protein